MNSVRGENGRMPRKVHYADRRQNVWLVRQLKKRPPLHEVDFVPVKRKTQLWDIKDEKIILLWGDGMEHDFSFFIDIMGGRKRNIDGHHDCCFAPDDMMCIHAANHMAHSAVKNGVKVEITLPDVTCNDDPTYYGIINNQRLLGGVEPIRILPISVPFRGDHLSMDLDCVELFPADSGFMIFDVMGFEINYLVVVLDDAIKNGNLRRLDVGGLSAGISTALEVNGDQLPDNIDDVPKKSVVEFADGKLDKYCLRIAGFVVKAYYDILKTAIWGLENGEE